MSALEEFTQEFKARFEEKAWSSSAHPRAAAGSSTGGEFVAASSSDSKDRVAELAKEKLGKLTPERIKEFQRANGLKVDGAIGRQTLEALMGNGDKARRTQVGQVTDAQLRALGPGTKKKRRPRKAKKAIGADSQGQPLYVGDVVETPAGSAHVISGFGRNSIMTAKGIFEGGSGGRIALDWKSRHFEEGKIRRWPKGDKRGGKFAPKTGGGGGSGHSSGGSAGGSSSSSGGTRSRDQVQLVEDTVTQLQNGEHAHLSPDALGVMGKQLAGRNDLVDLGQLHIDGMDHGNLFDKHETDRPRGDMPQIPPDQVQAFLDSLRKGGAKVRTRKVHPSELHATQKEVNGVKSAKIAAHYDPSKAGLAFASREGAILDGHHRWAAGVFYEIDNPDYTMDVAQVDMGITDLLKLADDFNAKQGIAHLAMGEVAKEG